jgi:hypothetical protein
MAFQEHVESLRSKHARLEQQIQEELHRPMPDQSTLTRLKREKLKIKEQLARVRPEPAPGGVASPALT